MIKKIGRDLLILFCFVALWASTSRKAMGYLNDLRTSNEWWGKYDWLYGNLAGMSHLDFVKRFRSPEDYSGKRPVYDAPKKIALYVQGDSHTRHPGLVDSNFAGVAAFHFIRKSEKYYFHLDTTKKNILIIEIAESNVRKYFMDLGILHDICDSSELTGHAGLNDVAHTYYASLPFGISINDFFNPYINQNLEFNLFNYNFMIPLFGTKVAINYFFFKRASGDVVISNNGRFLFHKETVEVSGPASSYSPVSARDIDTLVENFNTINDHYKTAGFREVYLSIIPNSATIIQPEGYNNLVPLLQNDPRMKIKIIDMYSVFKNSTELYYLPGDMHWNDKGFHLWLAKVNGLLLNSLNEP